MSNWRTRGLGSNSDSNRFNPVNVDAAKGKLLVEILDLQ